MTRLLGLLLVTVTLSLGSCQCSNKPDIGPVEEDQSFLLDGPVPSTDFTVTARQSRA